MPSGYTHKRRIGWVRTDGGGGILTFLQIGDAFYWVTPKNDVSVSNLSTTATSFVVSAPPGTVAILSGRVSHGTAERVLWLYSPVLDDVAASNTGPLVARTTTSGGSDGFQLEVFTNSSSQIRAVSSGGSTTLVITTSGWNDTRGK